MKRILLYMSALALLLLGDQGTDIGTLRPVEVVQLTEERGVLILKTDTGDYGWGLTVEQAVRKLKETTPGEIYLDTADYLLLENGTEKYLNQLRVYLKKGTKVALAEQGLDLRAAAAYLRIHSPSRTIKKGMNPAETLVYEGGKMNLKKFQDK